MIQPEALKKNEPLFWSPGNGLELWEMFCACIAGDLDAVKRLLEKDPRLVRSHYEYRTPLSFAVRENQLEVAAYLIEHGASFGLGNVLEMARDRGYQEMQQLLETALAGARAQDLRENQSPPRSVSTISARSGISSTLIPHSSMRRMNARICPFTGLS